MAILNDVLYDPSPDGQGTGSDSGTSSETDTSGGGDQAPTEDQPVDPAQ